MESCAFCHENLEDVRPRRLPDEEERVPLCRDCWLDVQQQWVRNGEE